MEPNHEIGRAIGRLEGKLDLVIDNVAFLKTSFETMEKGRLSKLEVVFATLQTEVNLKARNTAFYTGIIASIISSIVSAVVLYALFSK